VIFDPISRVFDSVNDPTSEPTLVSEQNMTALPIVALPPAADRLPTTVAFDVVPLPVASRPLLPGPAAKAGPAAGPTSASMVIAATASQPTRRNVVARRRAGEAVGEFIDKVPESAAGSAADESTSIGSPRSATEMMGHRPVLV